jgi:hypothetical protein
MATKALAPWPISYKDPAYAAADAATSSRLGLPVGMLDAIRTAGEKTNSDQTSSAGARTPYQIIPATRDAILKQYGIDAYLSPETASEAAGILLRDSMKRAGGDPEKAVREYHGGTDPKNWGPINEAYWKRVSASMRDSTVRAISEDFGKWMAQNPAQPQEAAPAAPGGATPDMVNALQHWLKGGEKVPGTPVPADRIPPPLGLPVEQPKQKPSDGPGFLDRAAGVIEGPASVVLNMIGGGAGMVAGTAAGLGKAAFDAATGKGWNPDTVERGAVAGAKFLTDQSTTETGRQIEELAGKAMQEALPAFAALPGLPAMSVMPAGNPATLARAAAEGTARDLTNFVARPVEALGMAAPGAAGEAAASAAGQAAGAVASGAQRVAQLAQGATTLPRRALAALTGEAPNAPAAGTMGSAGAAGTDMAAQRIATAESLPVPVRLTKGDATRDAAQLKFENEASKNPTLGVPLRERIIENNDNLLRNFDAAIDMTGAEAPTLRAVGGAVDQALVKQATADKARVRAMYAAAEKAGEMEQPVTLSGMVQHLNESAPDAATAPLLDVARARALRLGIAADDGSGNLVAQPVTLKIAETYRQAINRATDFEPTNVRQSTIIKGLVDEATNGVGGDLYRQARAARARYAQNYENNAVIAKLMSLKRGTSDRQVALEDVFQHSILKGSLDDVRQVRRVLQRSGPEGQQAWRELQGATAGWLRDTASTTATDSAGRRVISPAALDKAIRGLDADGKLQFVFGRQGAQTLRDLRDVAQYVKTAPPEAAVNYSNTASVLLAGFGDIAGAGITGVPAPIATLGRLGLKYIKDQALKRRIEDALNNAQRTPKTTQQAPGATVN